MGTNTGNILPDLEYPLAFVESMGRMLETKPDRPPFKYVHLSGKFVRQNQEEQLCFLEEARKMKVCIVQPIKPFPCLTFLGPARD